MALHVTLIYAPAARQVHERALELADGSTVADAVVASDLVKLFPELADAPLRVGIWCREVAAGQALHDLDRVEVYRPLAVDPKVARRARFVTQGARSAGLFARKRPGSKAGY